MTSVEAEIAFGLENLGLPQQEMFHRVAEVMSFLNLSPLKEEFTANLSGGQKQKVALASVSGNEAQGADPGRTDIAARSSGCG